MFSLLSHLNDSLYLTIFGCFTFFNAFNSLKAIFHIIGFYSLSLNFLIATFSLVCLLIAFNTTP